MFLLGISFFGSECIRFASSRFFFLRKFGFSLLFVKLFHCCCWVFFCFEHSEHFSTGRVGFFDEGLFCISCVKLCLFIILNFFVGFARGLFRII